MFLCLLVPTLAAFVITRRVVAEQGDRALSSRAAEAATLLENIGAQVETAFASLGGVLRATNGDEAAFLAASDREVAGGSFETLALVARRGNQFAVATSEGGRLKKGMVLTGPAARLAERTVLGGSLLSDIVTIGGDRRMAFAVAAQPGVSIIYGESVLSPANDPRLAPRGPFDGIDVALFLNPTLDAESLVLTTAALPLRGDTVTVPVRVGGGTWTLIVAERGALMGSASNALPWVVGAIGLVIAAASAILLEVRLRRRVEQARAADFEHAARMKSVLLSTVSHELRTPLTVVLGMADTLRRYGDDLGPQERASMYGRMVTHAKRLSRLIEDLLDATNLEFGSLAVVCEPVSAGKVVHHVVSGYDEERRRRLDLSINPDTPLVLADADRLEQVLVNLVDNALKYSPTDTAVHIEVAAEGGDVCLTVRDHGQGIAEDFLPHVYSAFTRSSHALRGWAGGVGLGLYITRGLVEAMGGEISVVSALGEGTSVQVRLAIAERFAPAAPAPAPAAAPVDVAVAV